MTATNKNIPGKRIKTWHRRDSRGLSLRAFVRDLLAFGNDNEKQTATKWAGGKVAP